MIIMSLIPLTAIFETCLVVTMVVTLHVWANLHACGGLVLRNEVLLEEELLIVARVALTFELEPVGSSVLV